MVKAALFAVALAACGGSSATSTTGATTTTAAAKRSSAAPMDMGASMATASEEVTFHAGADVVPGTVVHPTAPGKYRAMILMAGSGPTDRDWNSPLLPGKNGSAKLLAEELGKRGVVVLRFDKASVGANKTSLENKTFDIYRDQARAALAYLRTRPDVATDGLIVAGHSEGGLHAIRVAVAEGPQIAGLMLLSASGRSMEKLILAQVETQLRAAMPAQADAELASMKATFADFIAGKAVDPTKSSTLPPIQQLMAAIVNPSTATLSRSMIAFDPLPELARVRVPIFIYNGKHDIQVDPTLDAQALAAANDRERTELHLASEADHVLKHETRSIEELRANLMDVQMKMNAEDRTLDPATVDAIATWLSAR